MGEVTPFEVPAFLPPVPLASNHDLSCFDCGNAPLNDWLRLRAIKSEARSARCFGVCARKSIVVGYYCIAAGAIQHEGAPRKIRQNMPDPIPAIVIGRLGVDRMYQGHGLGRALLKDALLRIVHASELVGARAVLVHAVDQEAVPFYARYGFRAFPTNAQTLFLPIDEIVAELS